MFICKHSCIICPHTITYTHTYIHAYIHTFFQAAMNTHRNLKVEVLDDLVDIYKAFDGMYEYKIVYTYIIDGY